MKSDGSLPFPQKHAIGPCPELDKSSLQHQTLFSNTSKEILITATPTWQEKFRGLKGQSF